MVWCGGCSCVRPRTASREHVQTHATGSRTMEDTDRTLEHSSALGVLIEVMHDETADADTRAHAANEVLRHEVAQRERREYRQQHDENRERQADSDRQYEQMNTEHRQQHDEIVAALHNIAEMLRSAR